MIQPEEAVIPSNVSGEVLFWACSPNKRGMDPALRLMAQHPNQLQFDWGMVAAKCIGSGDATYRIRYMFLEFENVATDNTVVTPPIFTRSEGLDYYNNLAQSSNRDYVKALVVSTPALFSAAGYESHFTAPLTGNALEFFSKTDTLVGVHGKPFDAAHKSKIFGGALVASPDPSDSTKDLIFARTYLNLEKQFLLPPGLQAGASWRIKFL